MSNERIDLDQLEEEIANLQDMHFDTRLDERVANANMFNRILNELARCYEEIDNLHVTLHKWGLALCPRSNEWFEWDFGCQSENCTSFDDDCRELVEAA